MKLIFCTNCKDLKRLAVGEMRYCFCKKSFGMYTDEENAIISSDRDCIPIGIDNFTFSEAIRTSRHSNKHDSLKFSSFVIRSNSNTIKRIENI